jgi:hypothetical protein
MIASRGARVCVFWLWACSSSEQTQRLDLEPQRESTSGSSSDRSSSDGAASDGPASNGSTSDGPASGGSTSGGSTSDGSAAAPEEFQPEFVTFVDPSSGFETQSVRDADRDVVFFDRESHAMVWSQNEDEVTGWVTDGNELRWDRSGVAFRVRFGTEAGNRRAFFTETDAGTICDLEIRAPEQLSISATSQTPPSP